jgi:hypothetical protein
VAIDTGGVDEEDGGDNKMRRKTSKHRDFFSSSPQRNLRRPMLLVCL